jgi:hypothetical protein
MSSYGMIALIGSGEFSDSMAEVHRQIMNRLDQPIRPVFIDTPAGFELNIDAIDQKAVSYFKRNFNLDLPVAAYRSPRDPVEQIAAAVAAIRSANYIFAGPGSPSYALRMWRDSPIWNAIVDCWRNGAALVFASAASLTLGSQTLPVYEIYKVGDDPYWLPGLNLLDQIGLNAVVIPHWNNKSGDQHDTRCCFIGESRFELLEAQLASDTTVLGIDEYTAVLLNNNNRQAEVFGTGKATLRRRDQQSVYGKGQTFDFDHPALSAKPASQSSPTSTPATDLIKAIDSDIQRVEESTREAMELGNLTTIREGLLALSLIASMGVEQGVLDRTSAALQAMHILLPMLREMVDSKTEAEHWHEERDMLLDLLINARTEFRNAKLWSAADALRNRLAEMNYTLLDTPQGTQWQR